jgi:hypothetical protein
MIRRTCLVIAVLSLLAIALTGAQTPSPITADALTGLPFRSLGPGLATGRIQDIEIDPKNPDVWYVASAFGGLWKTVNRGITFVPVFDDGGSFTLCCVVVDPKDSNVIWLGTGENTSQRSAHFGDGVYKSIDAGKTWKRVGLQTSEAFGAVFTFNVAQAPAAGSTLVLTITDTNGKQIRRLDLDAAPGLKRAAWDLRREAPPAPPRAAAAQSPGGPAAPRQGPLVTPGRDRAQLGTLSGDKVTALGSEQAFMVVRVPQ